MRKMTLIATLISIVISSTGMIYAQKNSDKGIETEIKMFPAPQEGFKQVYIKVPAKKNEENLKVELFVGKTQMVDCNRHFMAGSIKTENLDGWGYNYYVVESDGVVGSTRMACPDNKMTEQFVHLQSQMLRYNSKLPVVIYVPNDMEVKYRVWKAPRKMKHPKTL